MPTLRAQVVLAGLSNKPEDVTVNTFHFQHADYLPASRQLIVDYLTEFYNVASTGTPSGPPIAQWLSRWLNRTANKSVIKIYDLATPMPREPSPYTFTLGPASSDVAPELPAEVALCASFYAGRNVQRKRGRVYLGPWIQGVNVDDTLQVERAIPSSVLIGSVAGALKRLIGKPDTGPRFAVWSPTNQTSDIVTAGWVDNAWDTQRRRGQDATLRTLVP